MTVAIQRVNEKPGTSLVRLFLIGLSVIFIFSQQLSAKSSQSLVDFLSAGGVQASTLPSNLEATPTGDLFSIAPMVQDEGTAYYMTETFGSTSHVFDSQSDRIGANQYGSSGGWLRVSEGYESLSNGDVKVSVSRG